MLESIIVAYVVELYPVPGCRLCVRWPLRWQCGCWQYQCCCACEELLEQIRM
eukprot:SAG31_NODE_40876_length_278_cov_1.541899_1_plen_51_part_10